MTIIFYQSDCSFGLLITIILMQINGKFGIVNFSRSSLAILFIDFFLRPANFRTLEDDSLKEASCSLHWKYFLPADTFRIRNTVNISV